MKKCPFCTWEIPEEAVKCKHCWEFIQDKYKKTQTLVKRGMFEWSKIIFCPECHYEGETKKYERSWSSAVWCLLYLFFFIPGLIYEAYRGNNYFVCPKCGNKHIKAIESNEKQNKWKTWCLRALGILFWLPMLIGMLFLGSVQIFFIGLLGEYILSINQRVMKRPLVVEEERLNFSSESPERNSLEQPEQAAGESGASEQEIGKDSSTK